MKNIDNDPYDESKVYKASFLRRHRLLIIVISIATVASLIGGAFALAVLTQNLPSYTATAPVISPSCTGTLTAQSAGSGTVLFDCGTGTSAFSVTNGPATVTPVITYGAGNTYITVGIIPSTSTTCSGTGFQAILGTPINVPNGSYSYCATFTPPSTGTSITFASLSVNWN